MGEEFTSIMAKSMDSGLRRNDDGARITLGTDARIEKTPLQRGEGFLFVIDEGSLDLPPLPLGFAFLGEGFGAFFGVFG